MNDNKKSACFIGLHSYAIHKELPLKDVKDNEVGLVIINRCTSCGKIKDNKVRTVDPNYN